jgi:hypothetical protein
MGFGLIIWFTKLLQIVSTHNYNTLTTSHTWLLTTTLAKSSLFTIHFQVMDPHNVLSCSRRYWRVTVSHITHDSNLNYANSLLQLPHDGDLSSCLVHARYTASGWIQLTPFPTIPLSLHTVAVETSCHVLFTSHYQATDLFWLSCAMSQYTKDIQENIFTKLF